MIVLACTRRWDELTATLLFDRQMVMNDFDEELTYQFLIDLGCPVDLANSTWTAWAESGRS